MKNAWNRDIPSINEIIADPDCRPLIAAAIRKMLQAVGQSAEATRELTETLFADAATSTTFELEKALHQRIEAKAQGHMRQGMQKRAEIIVSQIEPFFVGQSLADVGCGHGLVAWAARKRFREILLLDIVDYRDLEVTLPFLQYSDGASPPFEHPFDCTLLVTVLHHARDPMQLLNDVWQNTNQRLIIIESVFGVDRSQVNSPLPGMDHRIQLRYAVFCDWFYNRVLNQGIPVPYNFNTPENWRLTFRELGAHLSFEQDLGVDLEIVPEHHFLFVLDKH